MDEIHKLIGNVTSIILTVCVVEGTNIIVNVKLDYNVDDMTAVRQVRNYEEPPSGYKSFDVYKGHEFVENGRIYTYSGSYTDVSNNSNLTDTYFKYYYKQQKSLIIKNIMFCKKRSENVQWENF